MADSPLALHHATPRELQERLAVERRGVAFLLYRDGEGAQHIVELGDERPRVTLGRTPERDVALAWDAKVSRLHAEVERVDDQWVVGDAGLSRNGTFVGGERVSGRRRLQDGDVIRVGDSSIVFRK